MLRCQINISINTDRKPAVKLFKWITSLLGSESKQAKLDRFVASKNPTNAGDVDYWIRYYDTKILKGYKL